MTEDTKPALFALSDEYILYLLEVQNELQPKEIAKLARMHPTTIHRALLRLMRAGRVARRLGEYGRTVYYYLV